LGADLAFLVAKPNLGLAPKISKVVTDAGVFSLGLDLDAIGTAGGATLAEVFVALVRKSQCDVVLVIDEVQQAMASQDGQDMLFALKAARDRVNMATDLPGRLLIVGTGSHKSLVTDMATRRSQAFAGAHTASFEPMGKDYVVWFLDRVVAAGLVVPPPMPRSWDSSAWAADPRN
jgi:hypothetical protein